jgi:hypothetical protein
MPTFSAVSPKGKKALSRSRRFGPGSGYFLRHRLSLSAQQKIAIGSFFLSIAFRQVVSPF